jgi:hypothetical protein
MKITGELAFFNAGSPVLSVLANLSEKGMIPS